MGVPAASFEVRGGTVSNVVAAAIRATQTVSKPSCLLVFCAGKHSALLMEVGHRLHEQLPELPKVLLSGPGVLSERGELDAQDATTGVCWGGGTVGFRSELKADSLHNTGLEPLVEPLGPRYAPVALFVRSEAFKHEMLRSSRWNRGALPPLFGAATHGEPGLVCCDSAGVRQVAALVLQARGSAPARVQTTHSCRLLSEPLPITRCDGSMVFELGSETALSVLERLGGKLSGRPLLFTVLFENGVSDTTPNNWLVRGIQGIDPARRALMISAEVRTGMHMTFAVKDSRAAREDLERRCRQLILDLQGGVPRFGLYFNCTGRGRNLYAASGVDTRVLKERFPDVPFAGFSSAFEIAPFAGAPAFQIYTGVLAVFASPS
jgi:FIST C domain/FIST N domain